MNDHTGTDRVADVEAQIQADFEAHPGSWRGDPEGWFREGWLVQEARLQALAVELDQLKEEVSEYVFEYIPLIAGQRDKAEADLDAARAELAAANTRLQQTESEWRELAAERDAANARCAELEESTGFMAISDLVHKCNTQIARAAAAEAKNVTLQETLDRVTALTPRVLWSLERGGNPALAVKDADLRAALTPEGTE